MVALGIRQCPDNARQLFAGAPIRYVEHMPGKGMSRSMLN
jgi:hypothetical protein